MHGIIIEIMKIQFHACICTPYIATATTRSKITTSTTELMQDLEQPSGVYRVVTYVLVVVVAVLIVLFIAVPVTGAILWRRCRAASSKQQSTVTVPQSNAQEQ